MVEKKIIENFDEKKSDQKIFSTNQKISTNTFFDQKFSDYFRTNFFGSPIPIPNFPKNPKIILRTPCDDSKETKTQKKPFAK